MAAGLMARCDVRRGECEERSEKMSSSDRRGKRAERREKKEKRREKREERGEKREERITKTDPQRPPEGGPTLFYTMLPLVRPHLGTEGREQRGPNVRDLNNSNGAAKGRGCWERRRWPGAKIAEGRCEVRSET